MRGSLNLAAASADALADAGGMSMEGLVVLALVAGAVAGWLAGWRLRRLVVLAVVGVLAVGVWLGWAWNADSPFENDEDGELARVLALVVGAFVWAGWGVGLIVGGLLRRRRERLPAA